MDSNIPIVPLDPSFAGLAVPVSTILKSIVIKGLKTLSRYSKTGTPPLKTLTQKFH